jgi:hypothetical protein
VCVCVCVCVCLCVSPHRVHLAEAEFVDGVREVKDGFRKGREIVDVHVALLV